MWGLKFHGTEIIMMGPTSPVGAVFSRMSQSYVSRGGSMTANSLAEARAGLRTAGYSIKRIIFSGGRGVVATGGGSEKGRQ